MSTVLFTTTFLLRLLGVDWQAIDERIGHEYPAVSFISTTEMLRQYQEAPADLPIIVDVRRDDEYRVSRLPRAVNLQTGNAVADRYPDKNTPIIVYCSVGYRSAGVAMELQARGYTNVRNLRHSLFEWANNGYPMVNGAGATNKVHPFNRIWGSLVERELRAYEP